MPDRLRAYVEQRVGAGDFGNVSEYFRDLVRRDRDEWTPNSAYVKAEIDKALRSGPAVPLTSSDWDEARAAVRKAVAGKQTRSSAKPKQGRNRK